MVGWIDGPTAGQTDEWTNRGTDRRTDGRTDGRMGDLIFVGMRGWVQQRLASQVLQASCKETLCDVYTSAPRPQQSDLGQ